MPKRNFNGLSRREFVGSMAGLAAGMPLLAEAAEKDQTPEFKGPLSKEGLPKGVQPGKPNGLNLIVIICDTFRYDYLHCNGNERIITPNLDAFAKEATVFTNCYADGLPTIPARRVMHTGRSILTDRPTWRPLYHTRHTLAEILAKSGFTCGFIADTYHHFKPDMNFHRGFSSWQWIRGQENDPYVCGPRNSVHPEDHLPKHLLNPQVREHLIQYVLNTSDRQGEDDYFNARSCAAAAHWLRENKGNKGPFMLFLDMFDPHEPWDAPPRFKKMYRDKYPLERYLFMYGVKREDIRDEDIPILRDLYSADVSFSDYCVGRFLQKVKDLGLWDNTIVVFSSDHGTHLGEQGCVQKQPKLLNSCVAHVPLMIHHPDGRLHGKRIDGLASHLDFTPTFLSLLGVKSNVQFDGGNLWELTTGRELRDALVTGFNDFGAVHTHKWHYFQNVWSKWPGLGPQLYDLEHDPREERNVVAAHPQVVAEMQAILKKSFHA